MKKLNVLFLFLFVSFTAFDTHDGLDHDNMFHTMEHHLTETLSIAGIALIYIGYRFIKKK